MTIPAGDAILSSEWLSRTLETSPTWPNGAVRVVSATRIGIDYGLSGRIHRVVAEVRGRRVSLVVKQDDSAHVARERSFAAASVNVCAAALRSASAARVTTNPAVECSCSKMSPPPYRATFFEGARRRKPKRLCVRWRVSTGRRGSFKTT